MIADKLKEKLSTNYEGWNITIVSGPTGVGKTYLVSSVLGQLGYTPLVVNLASRENPVKSIIAAMEIYFSVDVPDDVGTTPSLSLKSLLTQNHLAEDVLLGLLAQYFEIVLDDREDVAVVLDDIHDTLVPFINKFLLRLRNVPTSHKRKIVVIVRDAASMNVPQDHIIRIDSVNYAQFKEQFKDKSIFLWEITDGSLGLANFINKLVSNISGRGTLEDIFFYIFNALDTSLQDLLRKLAIWALGYDGYISLEIYDLLSEDEKRQVYALVSIGILEAFPQGGFRFVSTHFMNYLLGQISQREKKNLLSPLCSMVLRQRKVFLTRRVYLALEKLGEHRVSRYVIVRSLRIVRFHLAEYEYELLGVKEHFLEREDVSPVEKLYLASFLWWLDVYDPYLLKVFEEYFSFVIRRGYLARFYNFLKVMFLSDNHQPVRDILLTSKDAKGVVVHFIDLLWRAFENQVWDFIIDDLFETIKEKISPMWQFIYYYAKYIVLISEQTTARASMIKRAYDIANDLNSPLFIVVSARALLREKPLSEFTERVDILIKAYRVAPPTTRLFELLVGDMLENLREISENDVIDEFIEFSHMEFYSRDNKTYFLAKVTFHYMVSGNLPKAKLYIKLLESNSSMPGVVVYLKALYAILIGDKKLFSTLFEELYQWVSEDNPYVAALRDMSEVWLYDKKPSLPYRDVRHEKNIVLWYLSFWTYASYYLNQGDEKEGLLFYDEVIESLINAGMEFSKNVAYVYKGKLLYKIGDTLRSREFIKSAYMFFLKAGYEEQASNLEGILSYIRPDSQNNDLPAKDIFIQWSTYYRRVDTVASLYESLIDMLFYISDADSVDLFLDRLISEMLYVLVAEKLFVFACKEGEIKYFKSYGLGSSGTSFSKTARDILKEGSMVSRVPSYLQVVYPGEEYTIGLYAESSVAGAFDYIHLDMSKRVLRIVESVLVGNEVRQLAIYDSLTGLYTRWYFSIRLNDEFKRSIQENRPLAILYMDIDDFKRINDRYGHLEGDEVLRRVGHVIKTNVRSVDMPSRYGGEEMVVMLLGSSTQDATYVAERLRHKISEAFEDKPYNITVSIGIASIPEMDASTPDELIAMADIAMYHAKRTGKNRVVVYSSSLEKN